MALLQLLVISLILGWIYFLWSRRRFYALMLKVPGPKGYPLVGVALEALRREDFISLSESLFEKYGKAFLFWLGPKPFYAVGDPQLAQEILNSPHCVNKNSFVYGVLAEFSGDGLMTSKNPRWSKHRKLLNPGFKQNVLLNFIPIFNNETKDFLELMETYVGTGEKDLSVDLLELTLQIITITTMGQPSYNNHAMAQRYDYVLKVIPDIIFYPWLRSKMIRKLKGLDEPLNNAKSYIYQTITKMIDSKLDSSENKTKSPSLFTDHILPHLKNGNFTYKDVSAETTVTIAAGFETTAGTVFCTLALLAMHPQYQDTLYEELLEHYPNPGNFEVTNEDIQKLDYLDRVLKESMRVIAPAPLIFRENIEDVQLSNGVLVPKGTGLGVSIFHLHRSKEIWGPEAKLFNPDNFLPDNIQAKHPYSFLPFVKGIRTCIGQRYALMAAKVILAKLLRNYKFTTKFRFEDLSFVESVAIKLEKTPLLELEKRTK